MGKAAEEHRGLWWLADRPDQKVHGVLSIEADGAVTMYSDRFFRHDPLVLNPARAPAGTFRSTSTG